MYEDSGFVTEKLAACIYAVLRFPENNPAVVAAWTPITQWQISVIDGRSIVEAYTKRRWPPDFSNSPRTPSPRVVE